MTTLLAINLHFYSYVVHQNYFGDFGTFEG